MARRKAKKKTTKRKPAAKKPRGRKKPGPKKGEGGRPRKEFSWRQFDTLCEMHCTLQEISSVLGVSEDTVERRCKDERGKTFAACFGEKAAAGKAALRRKMFQLAKGGNKTMLIWLAKNWLGMSNQPDGAATDPVDSGDYVVSIRRKVV